MLSRGHRGASSAVTPIQLPGRLDIRNIARYDVVWTRDMACPEHVADDFARLKCKTRYSRFCATAETYPSSSSYLPERVQVELRYKKPFGMFMTCQKSDIGDLIGKVKPLSNLTAA